MPDTSLPWRLFGRPIRPYALAVSLATGIMRDDPRVVASSGSGSYTGTPDVGSRDKFITIYDSSGISATSEYYLNYVYVSAEM